MRCNRGRADLGREVATILLRIGAVRFASDSAELRTPYSHPVYCDRRLLFSYPPERTRVIDLLTEALERQVGSQHVEQVAGMATAGLPLAALLADRLCSSLVYVLPEPAVHCDGRETLVEGVISEQGHIVFVDDSIRTGDTAKAGISALRTTGARCDYCLVMFAWNLDGAKRRLAQKGIEVSALCDLPTLLSVAEEKCLIDDPRLKQRALDWARRNYG